jgi:hypothetical protein
MKNLILLLVDLTTAGSNPLSSDVDAILKH